MRPLLGPPNQADGAVSNGHPSRPLSLRCLLSTSPLIVPTVSPGNVQAEATNSTTIRFTWNPPSPQFVNGINQGYKVRGTSLRGRRQFSSKFKPDTLLLTRPKHFLAISATKQISLVIVTGFHHWVLYEGKWQCELTVCTFNISKQVIILSKESYIGQNWRISSPTITGPMQFSFSSADP